MAAATTDDAPFVLDDTTTAIDPAWHAREAARLLAMAAETSSLNATRAATDREGLSTQQILRDRVRTEHALLAAIGHGLLAHLAPEGTPTP